MHIAIIIPAAGASSRYTAAGGLRSKLDEDLGGRPVLQRTVELFCKRDDVCAVIVAGPREGWDEFIERHGDKLGLMGVRLCKGGVAHRWETVKEALAHVPDHATHIAVHDAARPCAPEELIDRLFQAAERFPAVIPGVPVSDTIKRVSDKAVEPLAADPIDAILGGAGKARLLGRPVVETFPRTGLMLIQTPQVFERSLLERAYAQPDLTSTDDASLVERLGAQDGSGSKASVVVLAGDNRNIKITTPEDVHLARKILGLSGPKEREAHKKF